jgi:hypothetical protein
VPTRFITPNLTNLANRETLVYSHKRPEYDEENQQPQFDDILSDELYHSDDESPAEPPPLNAPERKMIVLAKTILSLISFGKLIVDFQKSLNRDLLELDLKDPHYFPRLLSALPTSSSTTHTGNSPDGNAKTPGQQRSRRLRQTTSVNLGQNSTRNLQVAVIKKCNNPKVENEIRLLCSLQHCRNVVQLLNVQSLGAADSWMLIEERLTQYPENWNYDRAEEANPAACQYLLDGVMALIALRQHRIIHRDISPGNFMWSPQDRCFKLLDFDMAVRIDHVQHSVKYEQMPVASDAITGEDSEYTPVGTKGYIAPELFKGAPYSWRTDLFSLGASFRAQWLYQVVEYNYRCADYDLEQENRQVFRQLGTAVFRSMISKDPAERAADLPSLMSTLLGIYRSINSYYRKKQNYHRTYYDKIVEAGGEGSIADWMIIDKASSNCTEGQLNTSPPFEPDYLPKTRQKKTLANLVPENNSQGNQGNIIAV